MTGGMTLHGHADPLGGWAGFLIPVFKVEGSNGLFAQRIEGDVILSFEQIEDVRVDIAESAPATAHEGGEARYAFAFARDDIVAGAAGEVRAALSRRMQDPLFDEQPMLALETAEFLGSRDLRHRFARHALNSVKRLGGKTASTWLDLAILTPAVREALAVAGGRGGSSARHVTASTVGGRIVIRGAPQVRGDAGISVEAAVRASLSELADFYPPPVDGGWTIHLLEAPVEQRPPDALIWLADENTGELAAHVRGTRDWKLDVLPPSDLPLFRESMRSGSGDGFFVIARREADEPLGELDDVVDGSAVLIRFGSLRRLGRLRHGDLVTPSRHRQVYVPSSGLPGTTMSPRAQAGLVRQVAAAFLATGLKESGPRSAWAYFRATGTGPDRAMDAWCALYDRLWAKALSSRDACLMLGPGARLTPGFGSRLAPEDLFTMGQPVDDPRVVAELKASRTDAAVLTPLETRSDVDRERHVDVVQRLLSVCDWHAFGTERGPDGACLELEPRPGAALRWIVLDDVASPEFEQGRYDELLDLDLRSIDTVAVTCDATASNILARVRALGQLPLNLRDLGGSIGRVGLWSLLGAQVRRLATPQLMRTHSMFMGLLVGQAFRDGRVEHPDAKTLHRALGGDFGRAAQLTWSRVRQSGEMTSATVRLLEGRHSVHSRGGPEIVSPFLLTLDRDGIFISPEEPAFKSH